MVRRTFGSSVVTTLVAFVALVSALGCGGRASKHECEQMLDKYLDMVMAEEPDTLTLLGLGLASVSLRRRR